MLRKTDDCSDCCLHVWDKCAVTCEELACWHCRGSRHGGCGPWCDQVMCLIALTSADCFTSATGAVLCRLAVASASLMRVPINATLALPLQALTVLARGARLPCNIKYGKSAPSNYARQPRAWALIRSRYTSKTAAERLDDMARPSSGAFATNCRAVRRLSCTSTDHLLNICATCGPTEQQAAVSSKAAEMCASASLYQIPEGKTLV